MVQIAYFRHVITTVIITAGCVFAAQGVTFKFASNSIQGGPLKQKMENNISGLLTAINQAAVQDAPLSLTDVLMEPEAKSRLMALWEDSHFSCKKTSNISKCINDYQGYQVRNIPITMHPKDESYSDPINRELTISLNRQGIITGVRPAWQTHDMTSILGEPGVKDLQQRMEILKWVEDFRCYYNERNIKALDQIYSDDALIITGSIVKSTRIPNDQNITIDNQVKYVVHAKSEYIANLKKILTPNNRIDVQFDHISIHASGSKQNIYGVTLHQIWKSRSYSDDGWLFLIWDFNDPERPQILVRTWQPQQIVAQEEVFNLNDFIID